MCSRPLGPVLWPGLQLQAVARRLRVLLIGWSIMLGIIEWRRYVVSSRNQWPSLKKKNIGDFQRKLWEPCANLRTTQNRLRFELEALQSEVKDSAVSFRESSYRSYVMSAGLWLLVVREISWMTGKHAEWMNAIYCGRPKWNNVSLAMYVVTIYEEGEIPQCDAARCLYGDVGRVNTTGQKRSLWSEIKWLCPVSHCPTCATLIETSIRRCWLSLSVGRRWGRSC